MKFLVDNQLPAALARFLVSRGVDCEHVLDIGLATAPDTEIWEYVNQNACVLLTKDEDFLYLANAKSTNAKLIWIRVGNCRTQTLLAAIDRLWPTIVAGLNAGDKIIELR